MSMHRPLVLWIRSCCLLMTEWNGKSSVMHRTAVAVRFISESIFDLLFLSITRSIPLENRQI